MLTSIKVTTYKPMHLLNMKVISSEAKQLKGMKLWKKEGFSQSNEKRGRINTFKTIILFIINTKFLGLRRIKSILNLTVYQLKFHSV